MNLVTVLFFAIVALVMISVLINEVRRHNILAKHVSFFRAVLIAFTLSNNGQIPENDWKLYLRFRRRSVWIIAGGMTLTLLLVGLDAVFHFGGKVL